MTRTESHVRLSRAIVALVLALAISGCAARASDRFVWVDDLPAEAKNADGYRIAPGDLIGVRIFNQDNMSAPRLRVREDGKISMPVLQDVNVGGLSPAELARALESELKSLVVNPVVTVTVEEARPVRISVLGEVARPGSYEVDRGSGVLQALAAAGGRTPYAQGDRIFVLRQVVSGASKAPEPARIRFRWSDLAGGRVPAVTFRMNTGDVVVVE